MFRFLFFSMIIVFGGCNSKNGLTPSEYLVKNRVSEEVYTKDKKDIMNILQKMLNENIHPFRPKQHFDSNTMIFIDTIAYSPDKLKMVALIITKNSTTKLDYRDSNKKFFYNGNYLLCERETENSEIVVYDYSSYNLVHYYDYNEIKERLYDYCFREMSFQKFGDEKLYNINDLRFWNTKMIGWITTNSKAISLLEN